MSQVSELIEAQSKTYHNPYTGREVSYQTAVTLGIIPNITRRPSESSVKVEVTTVKMKDLEFDAKMFQPIKLGNKELDQFVSSDGGFMPATNVILIGTPGIGKSTVGLDILTRAKKKGKKVLFISGEMQRIDMFRYCKRFPMFADLDIFFVSDYVKSSPVKAIEQVLENGYDLVLMDSWAEISRTVKDCGNLSVSKTESWILDLLEKHNEAKNDAKLHTCFLVIQQVTKSGEFVGSNRLKHMTSAMLNLSRDRAEGINVMEFSKNRVGTAGEQVSFRINNNVIIYSKVTN
jgi:DNA repair protein RadA/Sms